MSRRPLFPPLALSLAFALLACGIPAQADSFDGVSASPVTSSGSPVPVFERPMHLSLNTGVIGYQNPAGGGEGRFTLSALTDWNFSPVGPVRTPVQYGLGTGLIYSHVGSPGSNFFGTGLNGGSGSGNLFVVPADLWAGYYWRDQKILAAIHTGANLFLRTEVGSMALGRDADRSGGAADFFPVLGARLGYDLGENVAVSLRTDWTLAPNTAIFNGTLGATIPLS